MVRIFLVDDDRMIHQTYRRLFPLHGHNLYAEAYDGQEALELYPKLNPVPDLVLMDQRMPRMDGLTATRKLKELDSKCLIIFLSADKRVKEEALAVGAAEFISKPVRLANLIYRIAAHAQT